MKMTSIVRIKRRHSQEPAEALLLATKRMKVENCGSSQAMEENIFRFCGTTENEKENLENIAKLVEKGKLMSHRQTPKASRVSSIQSRKEVKPISTNSEKKYKVLNTLRNLDTTNTMKIYDLVLEEHNKDEIATCNGIPLVVEKCEVLQEDADKKCVFDLYYCEGGTFDDSYIDRLMSVQPYFYHSEDHEDSSDTENSDDSNDENNCRNEYPDTEEDQESDDDVIGKMSGMHLDQNNELSSDDEDFVYSKDDYGMHLDRNNELSSDDEDFIYSTDDDPRHGDAYSKYKKRVMKDLQGSDYESDSDDPSDDKIVVGLD